MEERLKQISDRVSIPLVIIGTLLTLAAMGSGLSLLVPGEKPPGFHPAGAAVSLLALLASGLSSVLTFVYRRRPFAPRLGQVAGALLSLYGLAFPLAVFSGTPFFIPLSLYLVAATGIWALLKSR